MCRSGDFYTNRRDMNIFLALNIPRARRLWEPLPERPDPNMPRYRGSVYSLSSPSASSPTIYAGIENHVIQMDFVSTDDVRRSVTSGLGIGLSGQTKSSRPVLNLSCYERPQPGYEIFDPILLRKQVDIPGQQSMQHEFSNITGDVEHRLEEGWDERWRLSTYESSKSPLAWR